MLNLMLQKYSCVSRYKGLVRLKLDAERVFCTLEPVAST